ncbi:LPS-assembly protein LptD [Aquabacterium sp. A08]|uniref:LPS-assembly protein LptD n=1 Tax=Aquabacterium sp. A08 TaxID=2718532 RepID=UPI001421EF94|nr:LPS-assembly protein LptD [Aquabacterium sp. A08]NIC41607.1 LPS-assembly protein LptD [Aquabacterium sp. A08]
MPVFSRLPDLLHALAPPPRWSALACLCAAAWPLGSAAAEGPDAPLPLRLSDRLSEQLPTSARGAAPTFVSGDRIGGQTGVNTVVEGHAELRRHDTVLRADRLEHILATDTAVAEGQVRINRMGNVFEGPSLQLKLNTFEGQFQQPRFELLRNGGVGDASRVDFVNENLAVAHDVRYSTCQRPPGGDWMPDWLVTASRIEFDNAEETGTATNGVLRFKGVPILASPWVSFPLSERRKSGVLPPTINLDNQSGLEVTLPYYLNLAPDRDATLYPTVMSKRGLDLGGEFRYLDRDYAGTLRGSFMASDKLRNEDRWARTVQHTHRFESVPVLDRVGLRLNLNRVSDDNYWRDFPRTSTSLTERLLPSDAVFTAHRGNWSFSAGAYTWQTLQDVDAPIVAPYDRVPSISLRHQLGRFSLGGLDQWRWSLLADTTQFRVDRAANANGVNGTRSLLVAQLSRPWQAPGWYVTPGVQLHARRYQFESPLDNGQRSASYTLPTFTLDSGLFFDRDATVFGRAVQQTLEPRAYFVQTPYRDQGFLPVYDTAAFDFNLATVFTPNPYGGHDRIADTRALTLGLTTRLVEPDTGAELLSLGVAQRIRLRDQLVTLPDETPANERLSDLLVGASVNWVPQWSFNGTVQFNPKDGESVRTTLGARYNPGRYRTVSAAYRVQKGVSEQLDLGWQWPLNDLFGPGTPAAGSGQGLGPGHWYSVGRLNYSLQDRRVVDLVAGLEYDGGCWIGRVVLERLQQSRSTANQRILFQLEFTGFSRIGSNPLQTLRNNVPRYQYLREDINPPSRFERYE